jgi:hypothetical protein
MNALLGFIKLFSLPIVLLNIVGGIISLIWLAILREWGAIGYGICAIIFSTFAISFLLLPSLLLSGPGTYFLKKGHKYLFYMFSFLSNLYVNVLITVWCVGSLLLFMEKASPASLIPMLIWSYGIATSPWTYMASKEGPDALGSCVPSFFAQIGYIIMMFMVLFHCCPVEIT